MRCGKRKCREESLGETRTARPYTRFSENFEQSARGADYVAAALGLKSKPHDTLRCVRFENGILEYVIFFIFAEQNFL